MKFVTLAVAGVFAIQAPRTMAGAVAATESIASPYGEPEIVHLFPNDLQTVSRVTELKNGWYAITASSHGRPVLTRPTRGQLVTLNSLGAIQGTLEVDGQFGRVASGPKVFFNDFVYVVGGRSPSSLALTPTARIFAALGFLFNYKPLAPRGMLDLPDGTALEVAESLHPLDGVVRLRRLAAPNLILNEVGVGTDNVPCRRLQGQGVFPNGRVWVQCSGVSTPESSLHFFSPDLRPLFQVGYPGLIVTQAIVADRRLHFLTKSEFPDRLRYHILSQDAEGDSGEPGTLWPRGTSLHDAGLDRVVAILGGANPKLKVLYSPDGPSGERPLPSAASVAYGVDPRHIIVRLTSSEEYEELQAFNARLRPVGSRTRISSFARLWPIGNHIFAAEPDSEGHWSVSLFDRNARRVYASKTFDPCSQFPAGPILDAEGDLIFPISRESTADCDHIRTGIYRLRHVP